MFDVTAFALFPECIWPECFSQNAASLFVEHHTSTGSVHRRSSWNLSLHFLGEEKIALLISKGFSPGLLYIVREATERGDDFRILGLTWMFVLMSHAFLVQKVRLFEDRYLTWVKGLPIHLWRTCSAYLLFYVILLLPELAFSISMVNRFYEPFILALLSGGVLMFIHAYLLKPGRDPEKFSTFLFWLFILSFFAVLSKMILPLSVLLIIAACLRLRERYYRYEAVSTS